MTHNEVAKVEHIERCIYLIRGHRVMLDSDLAQIYGVTTARLIQQVNRNLERFPKDFMFHLTPKEFGGLMLQFATSKGGRGGRRKLPHVFTEHGAIMLAAVLNSPIAVNASIQVVRAFVRIQKMLASNIKLARKLAGIERQIVGHEHDIRNLFETIEQFINPQHIRQRRIGFNT